MDLTDTCQHHTLGIGECVVWTCVRLGVGECVAWDLCATDPRSAHANARLLASASVLYHGVKP